MTRVEHRLDPLVVALGRADLWSVSLAGFLVRGGWLLFLLPIAAIPSPLDIANAFGGAVTAAALGGPNPELVRLVAVGSVSAAAIVVVAFALGAATDVASIRVGAAELRADVGARRSVVGRAFVVRLVALLPFAIALAATVPLIVGATYHELILPDELVTPLVIRVLRDVPVVVAVLLATWLLGEAIGGLAVRFVVLDERTTLGALRRALGVAVRRLPAFVAVLVGSALVLVVLVGPALVATALAWRWVTFELRSPGDIVVSIVATAALAALWLGGLGLAGFAATLRSLAWTAFVLAR